MSARTGESSKANSFQAIFGINSGRDLGIFLPSRQLVLIKGHGPFARVISALGR